MAEQSVYSKPGSPLMAPVDAATVVALRDAPDGMQVLLLKRHQKSRFMAGAFVFPGGRVDAADAEVPLSAEDRAWCLDQLTPNDPEIASPINEARAVAYFVAAVRELFEEAGVLLARPRGVDGTLGEAAALSTPDWAERLAEGRRRLNAEEVTFTALLEQENLALDVRGMTYWAHWLTPSAERRRYDTRFFVAMLPEGQTAAFDAIETTAQVWMGLEEAVVAHHQLALFLAPPTQRTLEELQRYGSRPAFEAEAARTARAVPQILPKLVVDAAGIRVLLPWDSNYPSTPGEGLAVAPLSRQASGPSAVFVRRLQLEADGEDRARAILKFWFGEDGNGVVPSEAQSRLWWGYKPDTDEACRAFADDLQRARDGEYDDWAPDPPRDLARILLLDQFSRNIFRGQPEAFASDHLAVEWAKAAVAVGRDRQLPPLMRKFFYMPLMHAEDVETQDQQVTLFEALVADVAKGHRATYERNLDFARRHRDIIVRFGRYPHRNAVLGRHSTPEEEAFLKEPGSRF